MNWRGLWKCYWPFALTDFVSWGVARCFPWTTYFGYAACMIAFWKMQGKAIDMELRGEWHPKKSAESQKGLI